VVEVRLAIDYVYIVFLLLGVYGWEYFQTFGIEYAIIRRRLPFRWTLEIPYLIGRISLLTSLILLAIAFGASSLGCMPGTLSSGISGTIAIGCSSTNLMIRTWVIWKDSRLIHILLSLAALGHWTVLILDMANLRSWGSDGDCIVSLVHPSLGATLFVYTMCYDFFVLVLSFIKLSKQSSKSPLTERLRTQGLLYFVVVALSYIPPTVFSFLDCAALLGITSSCALTASTIASSRVVRSLLILRTPHSSGLREDAERDTVLTTQFDDQIPTSSTYTY